MRAIILREFNQFFSNLTGLVVVALFLLLNGFFLFIFPDTDMLDFGYGSLVFFFDRSPYIFLELIPAITMRTFSEEFREGTYDTLRMQPIRVRTILLAKFIACLLVLLIALAPTLIYAYTLSALTLGTEGLDAGLLWGAYLGLFLVGACFVSIGVLASSLSANAMISFLVAAFLCYATYDGLSQIASLPALRTHGGFLLEWLGLNYHFESIRKGVLDTRDIVYFLSFITFFLLLTYMSLDRRARR